MVGGVTLWCYYDDCSVGVSPGGPVVLVPPAKHSKASAPSSSILQHLKEHQKYRIPLALTVLSGSSIYTRTEGAWEIFNPRCACAARVTVLGLCVCVCVLLLNISLFTCLFVPQTILNLFGDG